MTEPPRAGTSPMPTATPAPSRSTQALNFVLFQAAWFAAILGAAHGRPLAGTLAVGAVLAWHLAVSARPAIEARLLGSVLLVGTAFETLCVQFGQVRFTSGQPVAQLPPYWMIALWGLLAIALNVTMRWLKRRWALAALLGAIGGPMSYAGGVRLGAATFLDTGAALATLALGWALLMPLMMWLSDRFDGVAGDA
jgi:hypothetical protein